MGTNRGKKETTTSEVMQQEKRKHDITGRSVDGKLVFESEEDRFHVVLRAWHTLDKIFADKYDAKITRRVIDRETGELKAVLRTGTTIDEAIARAEEEK